MSRRVSIRSKLAGALAVPLVALVAVTVIEGVRTSRDRVEVSRQTDLARAVIGPTGLLTTLQNERAWPPAEMGGIEGTITVPVEGYEETRGQTDAAIVAFEQKWIRGNEAVADAFDVALDGLADLDDVRRDIDVFRSQERTTLERLDFAFDVFDRYTAMVAPFFDATGRVATAVEDAELREGAKLADASARAIETVTLLATATVTNGLLSADGLDRPEEIIEVATLRSELLEQTATIQSANAPYDHIAAEEELVDLTGRLTDLADTAISTGTVDLDALFSVLNVPRGSGQVGFQKAVHRIINDRADALDRGAEAHVRRLEVLSLLALVSALALTWLVARSITRPLASLTREAKDVAGNRLPQAVRDVFELPLGDDLHVTRPAPVSVDTSDEIADIATALNTVQGAVIDLAATQALERRNIVDMFVHLGRRNQNLLQRQLDLIARFDSTRTDPAALSSLFRLHHLATRMRRNAESLLVLAGIEPPQRWRAPVDLVDVIRSALGEVEDYRRVVARGLEPIKVQGLAAADLTHLFAELIENALLYSPDGRDVEVWGRRRRDTGGYLLTIVDFGSGMPAEDIAVANQRLFGQESFRVIPSKHLGHHVAGDLARRLGVRVYLDGARTWGIAANVDLPHDLLALPDEDPGHQLPAAHHQ